MKNLILSNLKELNNILNDLSKDSVFVETFEKCANVIVDTLKNGNKILICGNGGSASDAEHMAGEIVGRFTKERNSLPCISLTGPTATFTAIANDYDYKNVFSRQVEGLGCPNDVLICISTSGNSENVIEAAIKANSMRIKTIALTGKTMTSELVKNSTISLVVNSKNTARIQEIHTIIIHSLCGVIDDYFN